MRDTPIAIVMGSDSDFETIQEGLRHLDSFGVRYQVRVLSAHRSPAEAMEFASSARKRGVKVIIAIAGKAAHLAGVVAAHTDLPVLGVPASGGSLGGMDALLSTVQMPGGVPVGTLGIGRSGGTNACLLATRILALDDERVLERVGRHREAEREKTLEKDAKLGERLRAKAAQGGTS